MGLWTGSDVLLIGGVNGELCPPNASCRTSGTPLADGAALDPSTGDWRPIGDAPVPVAGGQAVVVGRTAYLLPYRTGPDPDDRLLTYEIDEGRWESLPVPFAADGYQLTAAGDQLLACWVTDEAGSGEDLRFDPDTRTWHRLPPDPLGDAYGRTMVWTGTELVLFGATLAGHADGRSPSFAQAAALDLAAGSWRQLPDSEILSTAPWIVADGELVNPTLGGADGGEVNNWGRTYPYGGRLDPETGQWSPLPDPPAGAEFAAGVFTGSHARYFGVRDAVLDLTTDRWLTLPAFPDSGFTRHTVVAAGTDLIAFGGVDWTGESIAEPELSNRGWRWSPTT